MIGHIQDDKGVREGALTLHGQALNSGARIPRQDETLLFLLDGFHFALDHLCDDFIPHHREVFEIGFDFLA